MHGNTIIEATEEPDFTTVRGLREAVERLPEIQTPLKRAWWSDGHPGATPRQAESRRAVVTESGQFVEFVSDRYNPQQHHEAFEPVVQAVEDLDVSFRGGLVGYHNQDGTVDEANVKLAILFDESEEFVAEAQGFEVGLGILASNSLDKTGSVHIQAMGLNLVCSNGMVAGDLLGEVRQRHMGEDEIAEAKEEAGEFIRGLTERRHQFEDHIRGSLEVEVETEEIRPLVEGLGIAGSHAEAIEHGILSGSHLVGEQDAGPVTVATVYNGVTNYYSHEYLDSSGRASNRAQERALEDAQDLLSEPEELVAEVRAEA